MVKIQIWDDNKFELQFNRVEKIDAVERFLKRIADDVEGIEKLWGCVNFVKVSTKNTHINIFFTDKQFKKFKPFLEELNGGEIKERYVR